MWIQQEKKSVLKAVEKFGTPLYIYSQKNLLEQINSYKTAFKGGDVLFCYALKSNPNRELCRLIAGSGFGADIVSGGELLNALKSGFSPSKIIFSGVGKTGLEIRTAVKNEILFINIESFEELKKLAEIAAELKKTARFSIRVNPDIDPHTHNYISTGKKGSKFGVEIKEAEKMYLWSKSQFYLKPVCVHFHLGSQIFSHKPYMLAFKKVTAFAVFLEKHGIKLEYIDIGGGWGVKEGSEMSSPSKIAKIIRPYYGKYKFIMEPGRSLSASCGILAMKTLYRKTSGARHIAVVDAGMNDFMRSSLYGARHPIINLENVFKKRKKVPGTWDIAGPVCESADFFGKKIKISDPEIGDVLVLLSAGAYGYSMCSNYNLRPKPAEVIIEGRKIRLIRKRQSYADFI